MITKNIKVGIINYGIGNIRSLSNTITKIGVIPDIVTNPEHLNLYDKIILPGVGAFNEAMRLINKMNWRNAIIEYALERRKPILGICLGMQILASYGFEHNKCEGLNLIPGEVKNLKELGCKLSTPHIGWNEVKITQNNFLFERIGKNSSFYFVNTFAFDVNDKMYQVAVTEYDIEFTSVVVKNNIYGTQFHPEKSSKAGTQLLKNFINA